MRNNKVNSPRIFTANTETSWQIEAMHLRRAYYCHHQRVKKHRQLLSQWFGNLSRAEVKLPGTILHIPKSSYYQALKDITLEQWKARKALTVHTNDTNGLHNRALELWNGLGMQTNLKKLKSDFRVNRVLSLQVFHSLPLDIYTVSNHMSNKFKIVFF